MVVNNVCTFDRWHIKTGRSGRSRCYSYPFVATSRSITHNEGYSWLITCTFVTSSAEC